MIKWLAIALLAITLNIQAKNLAENQEIIWVTDTVSTLSDDSNNMDVDGSTTALLFPLLPPQYKITKIQGNFNRSFNLLQSQENVCTGNKLVTFERKKFGHITNIPQVVFPGLRLYVDQNSSFYSKIQTLAYQDNSISITKILNTIPNINFGVAGGRKYGKEIDLIIKDNKWQTRFLHRNASDMAAGVIKMFERGRLDLIIEYPNVLSHYQTQDEQPLKLKSFSIVESQQYMLGNIMCSKSDLGLKLINQFNQIIEKVSKDKRYFDTHIKWFDSSTKSDAIKFYNRIYKTDFH